MKLKKTDIGKKVVILNTNRANYISKGSEYVIKAINDDGSILFSGVPFFWYGKEEEHYELVEHPNKDMEIGDFVIILEKTTTLMEGEERKITGFLCDDRNKIIIEGIIPGGWIEPRKLVKKIDFTKFRIKKAIELFKQKGTMFFNDMYLSQSIKDAMGKELSKLEIKQIGKKLVTKNGGGIILSEEIYTDSKYEELEIVITKDPLLIDYYRQGAKSEKSSILGKKFSELRKSFNSQREDDVVKLSCEFANNGGHIKIGDFMIYSHSLQVIKSSQYEEQTPVTVSSPL